MGRTGKASGIKFGDPPTTRGQSYDWSAIADDLRARPRDWALIFEADRHSLVSAIRNGGISALAPVQGFRSATANNTFDEESRRICDLWMMYDPDEDEHPADAPLCGAMTRKGYPCTVRGAERYGGRCFRHQEVNT
jgi:hypothetical protein